MQKVTKYKSNKKEILYCTEFTLSVVLPHTQQHTIYYVKCS